MNIVVLCAGGHAGVVIEALRSRGIVPVGMTDRDPGLKGRSIGGVPVIGGDDAMDALDPHATALANGLGNRAAWNAPGLSGRRDLYERFRARGFAFPAVVHAAATVASNATLAGGAQVMAGAIVQAGAAVGENTIVNSGALVEHDCRVAAHVHVAPRAILCGAVTVDEETHVGAGAIVLQGLRIGRRALIPAGAIVTRNVEDGESFGGRATGARA